MIHFQGRSDVPDGVSENGDGLPNGHLNNIWTHDDKPVDGLPWFAHHFSEKPMNHHYFFCTIWLFNIAMENPPIFIR
jgi:hypothetical protein